MADESPRDCSAAIAQIPGGLFLLTANFEDHRHAVLVKWVQQCSDNPPMVMVAMSKGQAVEPLIRESRRFVLCQISADDRFLARKFSNGGSGGEDPLVTLMTTTSPNGSPIVDRAMAYLDCEVVRHVELDSDHRVYVGQVHAGAVLNQGVPAVFYGTNGSGRAAC